uniref:Protein MODIFIER OF SNC1 1-like isoform X2 n=1 Tax=Rhizophora mucronata TaxID=61149 RepID=A0A2P2J7G6_RHIMU
MFSHLKGHLLGFQLHRELLHRVPFFFYQTLHLPCDLLCNHSPRNTKSFVKSLLP